MSDFLRGNLFSRSFRDMWQRLWDYALMRDQITFGPNMEHRNIPGEPLYINALTPSPEEAGQLISRFDVLKTPVDEESEWEAPDEVTGVIKVHMIGAGGAGGEGGEQEEDYNIDWMQGRGGGGASGEECIVWIRGVQPGDRFQYKLGAGGDPDEDGTGGDTRFGFFDNETFAAPVEELILAKGGLPGNGASGRQGGAGGADRAMGGPSHSGDEDTELNLPGGEQGEIIYPARFIRTRGDPGERGGNGPALTPGITTSGGNGGNTSLGGSGLSENSGSELFGRIGAGGDGSTGENPEHGVNGAIIIYY